MERFQEISDSPFTPSFGSTPKEVIGRHEIIQQLSFAVDHPKDPFNKTLITGVRGGGKTTILSIFEEEARGEDDLYVIAVNAVGENEPLQKQILAAVGELYRKKQPFSFKRFEVSAKVLKVEFEKHNFELPFSQAMTQFMDDFEMAKDAKTFHKLIITIDEAQADIDGLREVGAAFQQWQRLGYNVMLIAAGLPVLTVDIGGDRALSFLSRSSEYETEALAIDSVAKLYFKTFNDGKRTISEKTAGELAEKTRGYPYMVQLLGLNLWKQGGAITEDKIQEALSRSITILNRRVFDLLDRDLTDFSKKMLRYIVEYENDFTPKEIIEDTKKAPAQVNQYLRKLERLGIISKRERGDYQVMLPFYKEYVKERYS